MALRSVFTIALSFGLISSYILGAFMQYNTTVWIYLLLPIIYIVVEPLVLESPTCLLQHNRAEVSVSSRIELHRRLTASSRLELNRSEKC